VTLPYDYAQIIIDETASPDFLSRHKLGKFEVGENGDSFINPDFIDVLRYIRKKHDKITISLFTNFFRFTREIAKVICHERLVDVITTNIDGHDAESYKAVKGINYGTVEQNILDFIEVRKHSDFKPRLRMQAITMADYVNKVMSKLGKPPLALPKDVDRTKLVDDFEEIRTIWVPRLDASLDVFSRSPVFLWAERAQIDTNPKRVVNFFCPLLERVKHEAFISPDGNWYVCCYDSRYDIKFGNVVETSIQEVFDSERRASIIKALEERRFHDIGYPCTTVEACQWV
jgi:MoaA/NifB/PqqE/SkfB family radical SAM enzyme